jgi:hypothetical protein
MAGPVMGAAPVCLPCGPAGTEAGFVEEGR